MPSIDELVNGWMLQKFVESGMWNEETHGPRDAIEVVSVDQGWDCGCYSSWTREDTYELNATLKGEKGEFTYRYGRWGDFPSFITELDQYINNTECPYEKNRD